MKSCKFKKKRWNYAAGTLLDHLHVLTVDFHVPTKKSAVEFFKELASHLIGIR
jgi:hypothetical protein